MKSFHSAILCVFLGLGMAPLCGKAQQISKDELIFLTPLWKGERYPDGRPKVPDGIIKRMKLVSMEEAWAVLKNEGYGYQIAEDWPIQINPDSVLVGRAVTATFMPARKDVWQAIDERGKKQGKKGQNTWPVDILIKGDVYVADQLMRIITALPLAIMWVMLFMPKPATALFMMAR